MTIGNSVLKSLAEKDLNQKDLTEYLGTKPSTISGWKEGNRNRSSDSIVCICKFLGVSYKYLLTEKDNSEESEQSEPEYTTSAERQLLDVYRKYTDNGFSSTIVEGIYAFFPELKYNISNYNKESIIQKEDLEWISLVHKLPEHKHMEFKSRIEGYLKWY